MADNNFKPLGISEHARQTVSATEAIAPLPISNMSQSAQSILPLVSQQYQNAIQPFDLEGTYNPSQPLTDRPNLTGTQQQQPSQDFNIPSDRTWGEVVTDTGLSLAKGGVALGEMAVGTADLAVMGADRIVGGDGSASISGLADGRVGGAFEVAREYLTSLQSDQLQASMQKQERILNEYAEGREQRMAERAMAAGRTENNIWDNVRELSGTAWNAFVDTVSRPDVLLDTTVESGLSFLVPGGVAASLRKAGVGIAGKGKGALQEGISKAERQRRINRENAVIGAVSISAMEGSSNAMQSRNQVMSMDFDQLRETSPLFTGLLEEDFSEEEARQIVANNTFLTTFAIAGTIAGASSRLTGTGRLEASLFNTNTRGLIGSAPRTATAIASAAGQEGVQEIFQSGGGELAQNIAMQRNVDPNQDLLEGVGESAGIGFAAGGVAGGGLTGIARIARASVESGQGAAKFLNNKNVQGEIRTTTNPREVEAFNAMFDPESDTYNPAAGVANLVSRTVLNAPHLKDADNRKRYLNNALAIAEEQTNRMTEKLIEIAKTQGKDNEMFRTAHKQTKQINQTRKRLEALLEESSPSVDIDSVFNQFIEESSTAVEVSPETRQAIFDVYGSSASSLSDYQLETLANSKDPEISQMASSRIETNTKINELEAQLKNINQVNSDVLVGGDGFLGIKDYRQRIENAYRDGQPELAQQHIQMLSQFYMRHAEKAALADEIHTLANRSDLAPEELSRLKEAQKQFTQEYSTYDNEGNLIRSATIHRNSTKLVETMNLEAEALLAAVTELSPVVERLVGKAPETPVDSTQATDTEAQTTETTVDPVKTETATESVTEPSVDTPATVEVSEAVAPSEQSETQGATQAEATTEASTALEKLVTENKAVVRDDVYWVKDVNATPYAAGTTKHGQVYVNVAKTKSMSLTDYIKNSPQKTKMVKGMGITASEFASLFTTQKEINGFLAKHEKSHLANKDRDVYPRKENGKLDLLHPDAIKIETRATIDALTSEQKSKLDALKQDRITEARAEVLADAAVITMQKILEELSGRYPRKKVKDGLDKVYEILRESIKSNAVGRKEENVRNIIQLFNQGILDAFVGRIDPTNKHNWYDSGVKLAERVLVPKMTASERIVARNLLGRIESKSGKVFDEPTRDHFTAVKSESKLATEPNWFAQIEADESLLGTLSSDEQSSYRAFKKFREKFKKAHDKYIKGSHKNVTNILNNPSLMLQNEDGSFDENVITAMAAEAFNFIYENQEGLLGQDVNLVKRILGIDSKTPLPLHPMVNDLFDAGVPREWVYNSLGSKVMKTLGIKAKVNSTHPEYFEKATAALGTLTIDLLASSEMQVLQMQRQNLFEKIEAIKSETDPDNFQDQNTGDNQLEKHKEGHYYIRLQEPNSVNEIATSLGSDSVKDGRYGFLDKAFAIESERPRPTFEPVTFTQKFMSKTRQLIPERVRKAVNKYNSQELKYKSGHMKIATGLGKQFIMFLGEYQSDRDIAAEHVTLRDRIIKGKNPAIERGIDDLLSFHKEAGDRGFFVQNEVWKNMRIGMRGIINPQNNKLHRHLLGFTAHNTTIKPNQKREHKFFKLAVAQHFGIDVDKLSNKKALVELGHILSMDETQIGMDSIRALNDSIEVMDDSTKAMHQENILNAIISIQAIHGHERAAIYDALVNMSRYSETEAFDSDIFLEVDGITNGPIFALLQTVTPAYIQETMKRLNAGGIFFKTDVYRNYGQYKEAGNKDTYEFLGAEWFSELQKLMADPVQQYNINIIQDLIGNLEPKEIRKLAKDPTMTTVYGSGILAVVKLISNNMVETFYKRLAKADNNSDVVRGLVNMLGNTMTDEQRNYLNEGKFAEIKLTWQQEQTLKSVIKDTYGAALETALKHTYAELKEHQARINQGLQLAFVTFEEMLNRKEAAKLAELQRENPDIVGLSIEQKNEIFEGMLHHAPLIRTFFATGLAENILAAKTKLRSNPNEDFHGRIEYNESITGIRGNNDRKVKSVPLYTMRRQFIDAGVSGFVTAIHAQDAAAMTMTIESYDVLNVHDAIGHGPHMIAEAAQAMNKNFLNVVANYSLYQEVSDTVTRLQETMLHNFPDMANELADSIQSMVPEKHVKSYNEIVDDLQSHAQLNKDAKHELLSELSYVGQYYLEDGVLDFSDVRDLATENSYQENADDAFRRLMDEMSESDNLGSGPGAFRQTSVDQDTVVNATNSSALLEDFLTSDRDTNSPEHAEHLRTVVRNVISPFLDKVNLQVQNTGSEIKGRYYRAKNLIQMVTADPTVNTSQQTNAEVYAHELAHAITHAALSTNSPERQMLMRLFDAASKHVTVADLTPDNPTDAQRAKAQEIYDYIFNNPNVKEYVRTDGVTGRQINERVNASLDEFLAYALTNDRMKKAISKDAIYDEMLRIPRSGLEPRESTGGVIPQTMTRLMNWVTAKLNAILNRLDMARMKLNGTNNAVNIMILAQRLAHIQAHHLNKAVKEKAIDRADRIVSGGMNRFIFAPLARLGRSKFVAENQLPIIGSPIRLAGAALQFTDIQRIHPGEAIKAVREMTRRMGYAYDNFWISLAREMVGQNITNRVMYGLMRESKVMIDQKAKQTNIAIKQLLNDKMYTTLTDNEKEALTRVGLKADLSSLLISNQDLQNMGMEASDDVLFSERGKALRETNLERIIELLESTDARTDEIANIRQELQSLVSDTGIFNYYINQARGLGALSTGNIVGNIEANQMNNAHAIANLAGGVGGTVPSNVARVEQLIDRLATIHAINYSDTVDVATMAAAWRRELDESGSHDVNGFSYFLQQHVEYKRQALDSLFSGNKMQMNKGYIREITDPHVSFIIDSAANKRQLAKKGYKIHKRVYMDNTAFSDGAPAKYLYVSYSDFPGVYQKTTLSLTAEHSKGTSYLLTGQNADGTFTLNSDKPLPLYKLQQQKRALVEQSKRREGAPNRNESLVPVLDDQGNIVGMRYIMEEQTRRNLLRRHDSYDDVMGQMFGHMVNKTNSKTVNRRVIEELKKMYDEEQAKAEKSANPEAAMAKFIKVGANSRNQPNKHLNKRHQEYDEMWKMLPYQTKQDVIEIFGSDALYVPDSMYQLVFGYRRNNMRDFTQRRLDRTNYIIDNNEQYAGFHAAIKPALEMINDMVGHKVFVQTEAMWKELVAFVKDVIVIKSGIVLVGNIASNTMMLMMSGVNPVEIAKYHREGYRAIKEYQNAVMEQTKLKQELKTNRALTPAQRSNLQAKINRYDDALARNPAKDLLDSGIYQSIVEDISLEEEPFSYASRIERVAEPLTKRTPQMVKDIGNTVFMTHDTQMYKALRNTTQISDFVARYTLHKVNIERRGMSYDESVNDIMDSFVDYEGPSHEALQYGNEIGLVMFTKFFFRIQKVLAKRFAERPVSVLSMIMLQHGLNFDVPDVFDTMLTPDNLSNRQYTPIYILEQILKGNIFNMELMGGLGRPM